MSVSKVYMFRSYFNRWSTIYNISITDHFLYLRKVQRCQNKQYKIKHGLVQCMIFSYSLRVWIAVYVIMKNNNLWQTYDRYDSFMHAGIHIFFDDDISVSLAIAFIGIYMVVTDHFITFSLAFFQSVFNDLHKIVLLISEIKV